jgi:hypothetical protein
MQEVYLYRNKAKMDISYFNLKNSITDKEAPRFRDSFSSGLMRILPKLYFPLMRTSLTRMTAALNKVAHFGLMSFLKKPLNCKAIRTVCSLLNIVSWVRCCNMDYTHWTSLKNTGMEFVFYEIRTTFHCLPSLSPICLTLS